MKLKSIIIALGLIAGTANAAVVENFTQHTMDEVQAKIAAKNSGEVCNIEFSGEVGPEQLSIGINKNSNTVAIFGYMLEGNQALSPIMYTLNKSQAVELANMIPDIAKSDASGVDDESSIQANVTKGTKTLVIEKYNTNEVMFGVGDEDSLVGGYYVDIKGNEQMIADCVSTAASYL
ncbi:hypothetical protein phiAS5_ORF0227 [Aeromonas phage phiAS5]|uniref:Uncharacterized protein n=1 Tax=Aeromonas phage phiAS5 TaxID=879630 RepID=E1A1Y1_9CAUD|nr:hypothetical protein phiAS5_ORF0227 [Aeromonas phage phiAS5]ADM80070.1 hypothetical protein phiAS5_ORF0227 [Aeromonas phage phiAS5]BES53164.1 hypothetical protein [Aeromonas phage phiWae14]